jgi:hypothetical protein
MHQRGAIAAEGSNEVIAELQGVIWRARARAGGLRAYFPYGSVHPSSTIAMPLIVPRPISCDEAGFTGNHLLDDEQPYFAYASHDLSPSEAEALLNEARRRYPVQMPELKAHKLLGSKRGRRLLGFVTEKIDGRYIATIYDKRYALCCKMFEYIYEPVLQENNRLFYENGLHKFVAMFLYMHLLATPAAMGILASEFEAFLRSLDPTDAPTLLGSGPDDDGMDPLAMIRRFARGYNFRIASETQSLREIGDQGRWMLDLTTTAVFGHLVAWGQRHPLIEVVCDDSKPLMSLANTFDVMVNRNDHPTMRVMGKTRHLTWNMSKPLTFASSADHAGIQLADLIAGCAAAAPRAKDDDDLRLIASRIGMHLHEECIMPDMGVIDLESDEAAVNFFILEGLAQRADEGADPLVLMDMMYDIARETVPLFRSGVFSDA